MRLRAGLLAAAMVAVGVAVGVAGGASARGSDPGPFVFVSDQARNVQQVFVADAGGEGFRKLTRSDKVEGDPRWSADGTRVAFYRAVSCSAALGSCEEIWTVNADGTGERRLTSASRPGRGGPVSSFEPTWSPAGDRIAYVRMPERSGVGALYVMKADGSHKRRLLGDASAPSWSPDGRQIAFSRGDYTHEHIFVLDLANRKVHQLTKTALSESEPDWSPDGRRIAYERVDAKNVAGAFVQYDVFVMNADGTHRRKLSRSEADDGHPVWSSDGQQIAFVSDQDGDPGIYVVSADGAGPLRKVTTPSLSDYAIDWAPATEVRTSNPVKP